MAQPSYLLPGDRLERGAVAGAGTGLHLARHQDAAVHHDDVDLSLGASPVAVEDPEPSLLQVFRGQLLSVPAEGILGVQSHHLRFRHSRNRRPPAGRARRLWTAVEARQRWWITPQDCRTGVLQCLAAARMHRASRHSGGRAAAQAGEPPLRRASRHSGGGRGQEKPSCLSSGSGSCRSLLASSSMLTSLKVTTRTFFTNRAGRYISHTQASCIVTSKNTSPFSEVCTLSSTWLVR